jgi:NAD(P)-dependent dehydrogenase (short-subunit alcohol dehydrogenase family)
MASSLAVEWATKGVRVNALRHEPISLYAKISVMVLSQAPSPPSSPATSALAI